MNKVVGYKQIKMHIETARAIKIIALVKPVVKK